TIWPPTPELKIIHFGVLSSLILECVYLQWCFSALRRFPQTQMRRSITLFVASFMLLSVLTIAKYNFIHPGSTTARYLWYAYYIPFTFAPTFLVRASLCFGKADDYRTKKRWILLFLPPALLSVGILTNDLHQL
ncbi:histidine kinase N-terminal 7TM domain-containing protein, partial [Vibrio sp. FNV 38]|nr:histidine kinase N-terminal 7TM domain-containing protein [Vibrio sp. FNV 38]